MDITGPSTARHGYTLLTIIDYYSHYPFALIISQGTSTEFFSCLKDLCVMLGQPENFVSDNGTLFVSRKLEGILTSVGTMHYKSAVYHLLGNEILVRLHELLKNHIACILEEH